MRLALADDAVTGLEAAIVLIAFVVIGAVFSHVIISAGITLNDGTGAHTHTALSQAGSGFIVAGSIYAVDLNNDLRDAEGILLPLRILPSSNPVDLRRVTINLIGRNTYNTIRPNEPLHTPLPNAGFFSIYSPAGPDPILQPGEAVTLFIRPMYKTNCKPGHSVSLEILSPGIRTHKVDLTFPAALTRYTRVG